MRCASRVRIGGHPSWPVTVSDPRVTPNTKCRMISMDLRHSAQIGRYMIAGIVPRNATASGRFVTENANRLLATEERENNLPDCEVREKTNQARKQFTTFCGNSIVADSFKSRQRSHRLSPENKLSTTNLHDFFTRSKSGRKPRTTPRFFFAGFFTTRDRK